MVVYNIFLNIIEVFILSVFVCKYYSFMSRKSFCLLFLLLFIVCEICDVLRQNGIVLSCLYFVVAYGFVFFNKRKIIFGDIFILILYLFLLTASVLVVLLFFEHFLSHLNLLLFEILVGLTSKILFAFITYIIIKYFQYKIVVPNKQYFLVIITEIVILIIFLIMCYSITNVQKTYNPFIVCILLMIVFVFIIITGVYFNKIYSEKLNLEKQVQKEKYIKQSLFLIENINYDIARKEHQIYWILEKIKQLNHDENRDISDQVELFQNQLQNKKKSIYSKNLVFDTIITMKINELITRNITIKPLLEIESHEKYDDLEFVNTISSLLDYIQSDRDVTLHIKNHGMYILVELYALREFYDYDELVDKSKIIIDKSKLIKNDIYYVRFLLRGLDETIGEEL